MALQHPSGKLLKSKTIGPRSWLHESNDGGLTLQGGIELVEGAQQREEEGVVPAEDPTEAGPGVNPVGAPGGSDGLKTEPPDLPG